jgi:hypothetical protein
VFGFINSHRPVLCLMSALAFRCFVLAAAAAAAAAAAIPLIG